VVPDDSHHGEDTQDGDDGVDRHACRGIGRSGSGERSTAQAHVVTVPGGQPDPMSPERTAAATRESIPAEPLDTRSPTCGFVHRAVVNAANRGLTCLYRSVRQPAWVTAVREHRSQWREAPGGSEGMDRRGRASLIERYHGLIRGGIYSSSSRHGPPDRQFFAEVLTGIVDALPTRPVTILECGCGSAEWLEEAGRLAAASHATAVQLAGFDITPGLVELARERLRDRVAAERLLVGDVLDPGIYSSLGGTFDLVFAFDVVQQLPRAEQRDAVERMLGAVQVGGVLAVFDHDRRSPYGRRMGMKKWITRHLRIPLVPRWYIHAAYPPLGGYAASLAGHRDLAVRMATSPSWPRRALIVRRLPRSDEATPDR
jgi:ubiquinone/menaquinone biosynthesis C-methylase UbiE